MKEVHLPRQSPLASCRDCVLCNAGDSGSQDTAADALADEMASKLKGLGRGGRPPEGITFGRSRHHAPLRGGGRAGGRGRGRGRGWGRTAPLHVE